jgi:hypothetical protein
MRVKTTLICGVVALLLLSAPALADEPTASPSPIPADPTSPPEPAPAPSAAPLPADPAYTG